MNQSATNINETSTVGEREVSVYKRYFKINDKATLDGIADFFKRRSEWDDQIQVIMNEIGATEVFAYSRSGVAASFKFDKSPDPNMYKRVDEGFYPKKNNKEGRALAKRIESIKGFGSVNDALKCAGIESYDFLIFDGLRVYSAGICGSAKAGYFASIPWKDIDPAELEQYKKEREEGVRGCAEMDHLLWEPPAEWEEVKEWQVQKAMDEAKEH